ncbi:unnamed protein product, partial [Meganyctiphanes norvegica]
MDSRVEKKTGHMNYEELGKKGLLRLTDNIKKKKAPGPDRLEGEIYKGLVKNEVCNEVMLNCLNGVLESEEVPESWTQSRTKMIKKTGKPTWKDFRPIALTNVSYKIFMTHIREQIEKHLRINNLVRDNQVGFTEGGRIEFNHFMLQFAVEGVLKGKINREESMLNHALSKQDWDKRRRKF